MKTRDKPMPPPKLPDRPLVCEHRWVSLDIIKSDELDVHGYAVHYKRVDMFFCEKCLAQESVVKKDSLQPSRPAPDWY